MKLKHLKIELSKLKDFEDPKIELEQYITPGEIAATILNIAHTKFDDVENKKILDLCCGTGILGIASSFFSPSFVIFLDICKNALEVCKRNIESCFISEYGIIRSDVLDLSLQQKFDTCLINPPFGTRNRGIDVKIVENAMKVSKVVYVIHSSITRPFYLKKFDRIELLGNIKYELKKTYKFHKKPSNIISVDLYRIVSK